MNLRIAGLSFFLVSCAVAKAAAPSGPAGVLTLIAASGDTLIYTWTGTAPRATGFATTVTVSATNGTWTGVPANLAVTSPITYILSAFPWDSVTLTFQVWGTNAAGRSPTPWTQTVSKRRLPGTPTGTLDTARAMVPVASVQILPVAFQLRVGTRVCRAFADTVTWVDAGLVTNRWVPRPPRVDSMGQMICLRDTVL
jgi:hypothetical protein